MLLLIPTGVSGRVSNKLYHSRSDTVGREGNLLDAYRTCTYYKITYIERRKFKYEEGRNEGT
jgi:hypothetical protein